MRELTFALSLGLGIAGCSGDETAARGDRRGSPSPIGNGPGTGAAGSAGSTPIAGTAGTGAGNPGGAAAGGSGMLPRACAEGVANASPVTPTVWLVLDGSGSMNENFGGETRWQALRAALMDQGGVVSSLAHAVRFGMVLYSGADADDDRLPAECVELAIVEPALDNIAAIDAQLPREQPGGWTPTDRALEHVVNTLPVTNEQVLDVKLDPVFVVLATDGAPNDRCDPNNRTRGRGGSQFDPVTAQRVIDVVGRGAQAGMELLVISLAGGDDDLQQHLEQVTTVAGSSHPPFVPATRNELVATLQQIIGGASCRVTLSGSVAEGQECAGTVSLNGTPLPCNDPNGFSLPDERTVQLQGTACDSFLTMDSQVTASFPCGVYTPD